MARLFFIPQAVRIDSTGAPYPGAKANFYLTGTTTPTNTYQENSLSTPHANPVVADSAGQFPAIYLTPATTYRCVITESDDTQIDDIDPVHAPIIAADISVTDSGAYFAGSEVETILADIGANYFKLSSSETVTADTTWSGADILMGDNLIVRPEIKDFGVTHNTVTQSPAGTLTCDFSTGNSFYHLLTANITTLTLSNPPASGTFGQITIYFKQDGAGGAYTITYPSSIKFPGGTDHTMSSGNDAIDIVTITTYDGGTSYFANFSQAYA